MAVSSDSVALALFSNIVVVVVAAVAVVVVLLVRHVSSH